MTGPSPFPGTGAVGQTFWSVPDHLTPDFVGREADLGALFTRLEVRGRAVLSGLGGIGKTQIALKYAQRFRDSYRAVFWLNADKLSTLKTECGTLARTLELSFPAGNLDEAVAALLEWLRIEDGWLLILDNADDPAELGPFASVEGSGHVLITARPGDIQESKKLRPLTLDVLPLDEATEFLLKRCERPDAGEAERAAARGLADKLGRLPLALEQAGAYIWATQGATFQKYLVDYDRRGLKRLEAKRPALGKYPESVVSTWKTSFEAVRSVPGAADVLQFSAFLAPDAITYELLTKGALELGPAIQEALADADPASPQMDDLLQPLARLSLIRIDADSPSYSIHRLVQDVVRAAMDDGTRRLWAERAVRAVDAAFPIVEHANWPLCDQLLPHALSVASWVERERMGFAAAGRLLDQTGYYLYERGQYAEAEPLLERAMEIRRTALGERHPDFAESLNDLAVLYYATGRHAEAEPLYKQALRVYCTTLGEGHPDFAESLNNLGILYEVMGRHAEAEPLLERAMDIRRTARGEHHPDFAESLSNLAELYIATGRHGLAEPFLKRATDIRRIALGERHPDFAYSLNNLGVLYLETGRHAEAEPLLERAMEIRRTALGERHPDFAESLNDLAMLYDAMGRRAEAEPLFRQAVEILKAALGVDHPSYRTVLTNCRINQQEGNLPPPDAE